MKNDRENRIEIYDTTLRDGAQSLGVSLSLQDKLQIADALASLGVDYIEGGFPLSNPKDASFFADIAKHDLGATKVAAFGMTHRKGVKPADDAGMQALLASEAPVITIVGKSWALHVREVLRTSQQENLRMIRDSVALMVKAGREVIFDAEHFFDGWEADAEYAMATLTAAVDGGAGCVVLCDTNGGATVSQVAKITRDLCQGSVGARVGIHCHNDCAVAVANSLTAVRQGVTHVQGTINGIGERCGNADLTAIIPNLTVKYGYECLRPDSMKKLTEVSRFVYEVANLNLRENQPFVGSAAFAHKGGMHVHAVQRNVATYEHMSPETVGNTRRILVSELSGVSNIAATAPAKFGIDRDKTAQRKVLKAVMAMENEGYQFEAAEASFEMLIRRTLGGHWYRQFWNLDHYRCVILKRDGDRANTEATVKLRVNDKVEHMVNEGDGPIDSLHGALCAALRGHYGHVSDLHLVDYKVRVVNTAAETAAKVRVVIDWHDTTDEAYFGSVGVSENIIDASWLALVDAIEYKLLKDNEQS